MEDREFFDALYQLWSKTTGAEDTFWDYSQHEGKSVYHVDSVGLEGGNRKRVASYLADPDADFLTAMHGALPDLVRRLHDALDEADRADHFSDSRECRIAELELEVQELKGLLEGLSTDPPWTSRCGG